MAKALHTSVALFSLLFSYSAISEPLFWKASKGEREYVILGSVHMGKPDMYPLPSYIMNYLNDSDGLVTEVKLSESANPSLMNSEVPVTQDVLDPQQRQKLAQINNQLGYAPNAFLTAPAWQTAITLQMTQFSKLGFQQDLGIDTYITKQAERMNKPVYGLETVDFQLSLFTEDPNTGQLLLTDTIENWAENEKISQCLAKSWQAGDPVRLEALSKESEIDDQLSEQFIFQRNRDWTQKLDSATFLTKGRYLVVVGALHLVGEQSLIALLSKKGYAVSQISKTEPVTCI